MMGFDLTQHVSYVDEAGHSKDPRRNYLCLAGLLATEAAWASFETEWHAICSEQGLSSPFHMKDLSAHKGQFARWTEEQRRQLLGRLISAIRRANATPIGSVVSITDFNASEARRRQELKDPYFIAFQSLTFHLAVASAMGLPPGPARMIYAHHPEHSHGLGNAQDLWEAIRRFNPLIAGFMQSYECGKTKEHSPLQAADLWAYELGHHFEVIRPARKKPRWPFQQFVEIGLDYRFTHDFITLHDAKGVNGLGRWSRVTRWEEISLYEPESN